MCVCVLIYITLPAFLCCASTLVCTAGAGHTDKIPDILQLLLKVCIHVGTMTAAGLTSPKQRVAAAQSIRGRVGRAVCPPAPAQRKGTTAGRESDSATVSF